MKIINIGGPINSGKSTISKILALKLPNSIFIEVDDLVLDEEDKEVERTERWMGRLNCLYKLLNKHVYENNFTYIIFAYPMADTGYNKIKKIAEDKANFIVITLNPEMEKCMTNRGTRELTTWELNRIKEMYKEKFNIYYKSDLIINNTNQTPDETAQEIINFIKGF